MHVQLAQGDNTSAQRPVYLVTIILFMPQDCMDLHTQVTLCISLCWDVNLAYKPDNYQESVLHAPNGTLLYVPASFTSALRLICRREGGPPQ